jgi:GTPase
VPDRTTDDDSMILTPGDFPSKGCFFQPPAGPMPARRARWWDPVPVSKPFEITVEAVYLLRGRGVAVAGDHRGGEIRTGDRAELVGEAATIAVDEVRVELHKPLGKLAVVLVGVERDQVRVGQVLRSPGHPKTRAEAKARAREAPAGELLT